MTTTRQSGYSVGNAPPLVTWTVVRGDTAAFRVYVTDDTKAALDLTYWTKSMEIKRPNTPQTTPTMTDAATLITTVTPASVGGDGIGEFTVKVNATQTNLLETGDLFDIEIRDATRIWTVCQGSIIVIEDITNSDES
jgi:hypothetical protein